MSNATVYMYSPAASSSTYFKFDKETRVINTHANMIIICLNTGVFMRFSQIFNSYTSLREMMTVHVRRQIMRTFWQIRTSTSGWNNYRDLLFEFDWQHMVLYCRTTVKTILPPIKQSTEAIFLKLDTTCVGRRLF